MKKKLITAVVAFALALTVVAPVAASAQTTAYHTFTSNLTIGSKGADVIALQSFLESKGMIRIPAGVAKGYFGALTRSALSAYQIGKGITPTSGYFGPITRAAVMADSVTLGSGGSTTATPGCSVGAMFNSMTGAPCLSNVATPGCSVGAMFNSMTGAPCSSNSVSSMTGEGTIDVRLAASPADNANVQTQTDVPVYGIEFRARGGDVSIQTLDLQVKVLDSNNSEENPSTLINTLKIMDGSNTLVTLPVNSNTFIKDSNNVYYVRITGLNVVAAKDSTKTLTVAFSTNSNDNSRTVTIDGYQSNSVRTLTGNGVNTFYSIDSLSRTHTFKKPGNSTLTVSAADKEIRSMNIYASSTRSITPERVNLTAFNVRSSTGNSKLTQLTTTIASTTGHRLLSLELYDGSTLISSRSVPSTGNTVVFDNFDYAIARDTIKTLTIKGSFGSDATNKATVAVSVTNVKFEQPTGSTVDQVVNSVVGATHRLYTSTPEFALVGTPTIVSSGSNASGSTTSMTAGFNINVTPRGGSMAVPTISVIFATSTNRATALLNAVPVQAQVSIVDSNLSEDSAKQMSVSSTLFSAGVPQTGTYHAYITQIQWSVAGNAETQTHGFEDYKTAGTGAAFVK